MGAAHAAFPGLDGYRLGAGARRGMSVSKLPSGKWRSQVYDPRVGKNVSVAKIIGGKGSFDGKTEAKQARAKARAKLAEIQERGVTVALFWERWTTDPLFARPKESTNLHNRERTKAFAEQYGHLPIIHVGDLVVAEWLAGGKRTSTIPALRAMFNDARSAKGGRLIKHNPFAELGVSKGRGRRDQAPPSEQMVWTLIGHARELTSEFFAAWLQVAAFTGMRPGELDALRWESIDLERSRIEVREQFSAHSLTFTLPKNGRVREAPLTAPAREALMALPHESEFCFVNLRGQHFTASARAYHWKAVRAAADYAGSLYLATRHFAGSYMVNVLEMASEDVAIALGHEDGGDLVRRLYGHRDKDQALDRVVAAYGQSGRVKPLRLVRDESA
jgi:integrase